MRGVSPLITRPDDRLNLTHSRSVVLHSHEAMSIYMKKYNFLWKRKLGYHTLQIKSFLPLTSFLPLFWHQSNFSSKKLQIQMRFHMTHKSSAFFCTKSCNKLWNSRKNDISPCISTSLRDYAVQHFGSESNLTYHPVNLWEGDVSH